MVFEQILLGVAGNGATALLEVLFRAVRGEKDGLDNLGGLLVGLGIEIDDPEVGRLREWLQNTGIHKTCRLLATGLSKENVAALVANDIACSVLLVDDPSQCPAGTSLTDWKRWNLDRAALIERNLGDCVLAALPLPKQTQLLGQLAAAITVGQGGTERERAALEERIKPLANSAAVGYPFRRPVEQPPAHMRAAELLSGDHRLIPFIDRTGALKELAEWCVDTDAGPLAAQVVYGAGGTGKTRLATELCHEMRKRGWVGGIFQHEVADFLDGAERRVLRKSAAVRVVLIVRRQDTSDDPRKFFISKVARRQLAATEPLRLSEPKSTTAVGFGSEQRKAMYEAASTAIARRLGAPVTALAAPENLSGDPWGSPLLVVARALIETAPAEGEHQPIGKAASSQEVLDELLIREERSPWWRGRCCRGGAPCCPRSCSAPCWPCWPRGRCSWPNGSSTEKQPSSGSSGRSTQTSCFWTLTHWRLSPGRLAHLTNSGQSWHHCSTEPSPKSPNGCAPLKQPPLDDAQMLWHSRSLQQRRTWSNCHLHQCQHSPQQY